MTEGHRGRSLVDRDRPHRRVGPSGARHARRRRRPGRSPTPSRHRTPRRRGSRRGPRFSPSPCSYGDRCGRRCCPGPRPTPRRRRPSACSRPAGARPSRTLPVAGSILETVRSGLTTQTALRATPITLPPMLSPNPVTTGPTRGSSILRVTTPDDGSSRRQRRHRRRPLRRALTSHPHGPGADRDVLRDRADADRPDLPRGGVDPRDRLVVRVQCPHRPFAHGDARR